MFDRLLALFMAVILLMALISAGFSVFSIRGAMVNSRMEGLLVQAGDYGRPWFGQLMAGPQMIAWLIQLNAWMERFHFCYPGA